jgi:hypothetical protein
MKAADYLLIPYSEAYNDKALSLEKGITQGRNIQLEILKDHFIDRAGVFKKYFAGVALASNSELIGSAIGAQTKIKINDIVWDTGFGLDTKVRIDWRSKGVGRKLAKYLYQEFFKPLGLTRNFMTAKLSNAPVLKLVSYAVASTWMYEFVYLTIPTVNRIKLNSTGGQKQIFGITLFNPEEVPNTYYTRLRNGLGYFHTFKMYRLKIKKVSWLFKNGMAIAKKLFPARYAGLPGEGDTISFATLFDHTPERISGINEVLEQLEAVGIRQLLVCCRKNDYIYSVLKNYSINTYSYCLVSDFSLNENDKVTIDVRCL